MLSLSASQYFCRTYNCSYDYRERKNNHYYIPNTSEDPELWGPHLNKLAMIQEFETMNLEILVKAFWSRSKGKSVSEISPNIVVGSRAYSHGNVFECSHFHNHTKRISSFVKITLPQDNHSRSRRTTNLEWKIFFGDVILFFVHEFEGTFD